MKRFVRVRALVAAPLLALMCFTISAAGAGAAAPTAAKVVAPRPLTPRGATRLGPVSPSATVSGTVVLQPRDESALKRFISQVTDKHSALFHHYLTPVSFAERFGPTPASIAAVEAQLRASGLSVTNVARDGLLIDFKAPAQRVETAFRTGLARYKLANGSIARARTAPLEVPGTIAKYVTSVVGLDTTVKLRPSGIFRTPKSAQGTHLAATAPTFTHPAGSPTACSDATATAEELGGLTDDQIANAYGAFGLYGAGDTGSGQHIAIFELEPFGKSDLSAFDTCYFGATQAAAMLGRVHTINVDGGPGIGGGSGESILDIQDVSAFAPGANIDVYQAPNTSFASFDQYAKIVNDDVDQIVSTSWGICEQAIQEGSPGVQQAENLIFEQAAAQGQTVFSAAGDEGSNDCNAFRTTAPTSPILSVDDPSGQPYVVSTGGTTIDNAVQPASEHVWNDGAVWGAAGGGISESWPMPSWQQDSLVPGVTNPTAVADATTFEANDLGNPGYAFCSSENPAGPGACREVPDVSAVADEFTSGITIYIGAFGGWNTIGGTSSAAPMWAGMLADVNASPSCQVHGETNVGFVSPLLYAVASNLTAYAASFNDVKTGNNDPYGDSKLFRAATGYDMASGLGTPQLTQPDGGPGLAFFLCNQAPALTRPTVASLSPDHGFTSDPNPAVTITGTNFEVSGVSVVKNVQVGTAVLPATAFDVVNPTTITATFPPASHTVPPHDQTDGAGPVQVSVTLQDGETSAATGSSRFIYVDDNGSSQPLPTVTGIHSFVGAESGGNTVDIYGAGFDTGTPTVTFGGVAGTNPVVSHNGTQIQVTVPAFQNGVTTCDKDGSTFDASENAMNDICQTQVVVTTPNGSSTTSTILPLYEGAIAFADDGVLPAPAGEEAAPAATEYDYVPTPQITSMSTSGGAASLASENGDSVITIHGTGFNLAALDWVNFGNPTLASSQQFFNLVEVTGTKIEIIAPGFDTETLNTVNIPVSVQSAAGLSNQASATYAGAPTISSVRSTAGPTAQTNAGPDTGGTPIDVRGAGLANQVIAMTFNDVNPNPFSFGTQYNFTANSNTDLTTTTVSQNPAVVDTEACTVTDCSAPTSLDNDTADLFILYPPGDPKIDSITPGSGPANGGTEVTITGENLGCVTNVSFGTATADTASNAEALLDCGSTDTVTLSAPPGAVGRVPVKLETVESDATGAPAATGSFTYTQAPKQTVAVRKSGNGAGTITSSPAGIRCGKVCSHKFVFGTSVTLKAKPAKGSSFVGWSGGCKGRGSCKVRASETLGLTAKFTLKNCVVPRVVGKALAAAKRALKARFCAVGKVTEVFSGKVAKGKVTSQRPKAGTRLRHGGKVSLTVSRG
jgi:Pro-kumamolisin, activation domain/PASTA domain/IPT/TIG domain/Divergent InlB B-repeat domain